jgi:PiT family inorganic phosphate transporter
MDTITAVPPTAPALGTPGLMHQKLSRSPGRIAMVVFGLAVVGGMVYTGVELGSDLAQTHSPTVWPYVLLGIALLIALGFEFVNGFHDTARCRLRRCSRGCCSCFSGRLPNRCC